MSYPIFLFVSLMLMLIGSALPVLSSKTVGIFSSQRVSTVFLIICIVLVVAGIAMMISLTRSEKVYKRTDNVVYGIEKLTLSTVSFVSESGNNTLVFGEHKFNVEKSNSKYNNVVVIKTEVFSRKWLFELTDEHTSIVVYIDEHLYNRLQNGDVLYERVSE